MTKKQINKSGVYYQRAPDGELVERGPVLGRDERAGIWVCRRLADFPGGKLPRGGQLEVCRACLATIVFDPTREGTVAGNPPKVCMQCAMIEPVPFPH